MNAACQWEGLGFAGVNFPIVFRADAPRNTMPDEKRVGKVAISDHDGAAAFAKYERDSGCERDQRSEYGLLCTRCNPPKRFEAATEAIGFLTLLLERSPRVKKRSFHTRTREPRDKGVGRGPGGDPELPESAGELVPFFKSHPRVSPIAELDMKSFGTHELIKKKMIPDRIKFLNSRKDPYRGFGSVREFPIGLTGAIAPAP